MSGIAGIIHFDGCPVEPGQIEAMTAAMHYRGPDGINHWRQGNVALGQCMLCTTPESLQEVQPLSNEDQSLILVMDGRVDNWVELRRELLCKGAVLRTQADAELVLRAYEVWGPNCLRHIDGDFALVIWDVRQRVAFCARDRIGNKPFHYHWNGSTLAFASELHSILELPWIDERPNNGMLVEFLASEIDSLEETLWEGVMRLAPAHTMTVTSKGALATVYWEPNLDVVLPFTRDEEYFDRYRELLMDSVRRLSRSHRPLAFEVSGGLDSSALFCVADHLNRTGELQASGLNGYTLLFGEDTKANELMYARAVGSHLGVIIREIPGAMMPLHWYQKCAHESRDFSGYPNGVMGKLLFEQAANDGSRVVINGVGGDEWLNGSRVYYAEALSQFDIKALCKSLSGDASAYGVKQAFEWFVRYGMFLQFPHSLQAGFKAIAHRIRGHKRSKFEWLSTQALAHLTDRQLKTQQRLRAPTATFGQQLLNRTLSDGFRVLSGEITERMAAKSGLEVRQPFHSVNLVQFAFATPERLRLYQGINKYIHVKSLQGIMPQQVLERKSKAVFSHLFRDHLSKMQELLTHAIPHRRTEWLSEEGIKKLYETFQKSTHMSWPFWPLWMIFICDAVLNVESEKA